ncbi:hypothetical protein CDCA_CDCA17G4466 [Cyanidium caldarium]|uniref:Guanine nucleotide-binding protein subunit beta-like protein n=1 Tax=Cyanidium caldarium TaxID=2771 RepID=A0AAV9J201_CYACA|nr:hypothetical protein CDCA_CDCA17G4466 [Cyanidium caldarium]
MPRKWSGEGEDDFLSTDEGDEAARVQLEQLELGRRGGVGPNGREPHREGEGASEGDASAYEQKDGERVARSTASSATVSTNSSSPASPKGSSAPSASTPVGAGRRSGQTPPAPSVTSNVAHAFESAVAALFGTRSQPEKRAISVGDTEWQRVRYAVRGQRSLCAFFHARWQAVFVVTETSIESFSVNSVAWRGEKLLDRRLPVVMERADRLERESRHNRGIIQLGGEAGARILRATAALYLPREDEILVAHQDHTLRWYSCESGQLGVECRSLKVLSGAEASPSRIGHSVTCLQLLDADHAVSGHSDGTLRVWRVCSPVACTETIAALPRAVRDTRRAAVRALTVTHHTTASAPPSIFVAYDSGVIGCCRAGGAGWMGHSVAGHAAAITALVPLVDDAFLLSASVTGELALTEPHSGRCLARTMLPFRCHLLLALSDRHVLAGGDSAAPQLLRVTVLPYAEAIVELRLELGADDSAAGGGSTSRLGRLAATATTPISHQRCASLLDAEGVVATATHNGHLDVWYLSERERGILEATQPRVATGQAPDRDGRLLREQLAAFMAADAPAHADGDADGRAVAQWGTFIEAQSWLQQLASSGVLPDGAKDQLVRAFQRTHTEALQRVREERDRARHIAAQLQQRLPPSAPEASATTTTTTTTEEQRLQIAAYRHTLQDWQWLQHRHTAAMAAIERTARRRLAEALRTAWTRVNASEAARSAVDVSALRHQIDAFAQR